MDVATAGVSSDALTFRVADPGRRFAAVRLRSDLPLSDEQRTFARDGGQWVLRIEPPPIARLEYQLEVDHANGTDVVLDPGSPRAPGAFGEKSVMLAPGYAPPDWLGLDGAEAPVVERSIRARGLHTHVHVRIWGDRGPLLVAHDGPELDELAGLSRYSAAMVALGELPPHRVAMLAPGHRDEWYSGSALYARALVTDVLPALDPIAPVGMGVSLGGLAMLHAHARHGAFDALFLQSGSFFVPRFDVHESRFPRYRRVVRVVRELYRDAGPPVPVTLTCGVAEENLANNRAMALALTAQKFDTVVYENPDMHNYTGWRDALDPHLTRLLAKMWS